MVEHAWTTVVIIVTAAVFTVAASAFINWASGKSAVWNVVFAVMIVLALTLAALGLIRWLEAVSRLR